MKLSFIFTPDSETGERELIITMLREVENVTLVTPVDPTSDDPNLAAAYTLETDEEHLAEVSEILNDEIVADYAQIETLSPEQPL